MRRLALPLVAALAAGALLAPPASAAPDPTGLLCGFSTVVYPPARLRQAGEIDAGPLVLGDDADATVTYAGSITCTIQSGARTHDGPDAAVVTGPVTPHVAHAAGTVNYVPYPDQFLYLCTRVDLTNGTTLYWDESPDPGSTGAWSADAGSACAEAVSSSTAPPCAECPSCEVLTPALPPDGDVPGAWDCPPYHS